MISSASKADVSGTSPVQLPDYADELNAFHRAFGQELRDLIRSLPITPQMRVLDVGCGDGFYLRLFTERLAKGGSVVGLDINPAYLEIARRNPLIRAACCDVEFVEGNIFALPSEIGQCDFVWCAQSLYGMPDPVVALNKMTLTLRPGGLIALLENDTLHQILLPWPSDLELAIRSAEYIALSNQTVRPNNYYIGRQLPNVLASAGVKPVVFHTQCIDRQTPLDSNLISFLQSYLEALAQRVKPLLDSSLAREFEELIDPHSERYLLSEPHFTMSWLNILALGQRVA